MEPDDWLIFEMEIFSQKTQKIGLFFKKIGTTSGLKDKNLLILNFSTFLTDEKFE